MTSSGLEMPPVQKAFQSALKKLRNDLRKQIEKWVVEFAIDGAGQMDKPGLLALLDRIEARMQARALASPPEPDDDDDGGDDHSDNDDGGDDDD